MSINARAANRRPLRKPIVMHAPMPSAFQVGLNEHARQTGDRVQPCCGYFRCARVPGKCVPEVKPAAAYAATRKFDVDGVKFTAWVAVQADVVMAVRMWSERQSLPVDLNPNNSIQMNGLFPELQAWIRKLGSSELGPKAVTG